MALADGDSQGQLAKQDEPTAIEAPAADALDQSPPVEYEQMTPQQQEAYKERAKTEAAAAVIILALFIFFVATISAFRFSRGYKQYLKLKKEKKSGYVDIWGNPRVQKDDLPTDDEMMGKDELL
ncbi:MAG: hypothetical protein JXM68_07480 [Sedimentisphaerales bacterium]|nr:hypothetical protein [Sedimentisphaerales bacterium]